MPDMKMFLTITLSANDTVVWSKRREVDNDLNRAIPAADQEFAILAAEEALLSNKSNKKKKQELRDLSEDN